ncbi:MAG: electron transport complex subunit RsxC [Emergencia sp.]
MKRKKLNRGVHPYDGKELSKDSPIRQAAPASVMVYPLSQHIGAPARAAVSVGEQVLRGQMIAEADGFVSAPVYSSVSGTVRAIEPRPVAGGKKEICIVIDNDNLDHAVETFGKERSLEDLSKESILQIISTSGIVGLGRTGYPAGAKLSPENPLDIDTLIINGSECEPYLTADYRLMIEKSSEILLGVKAVLKLFDNAKAVIGIEGNKPEAVRAFEEKTASEDRISVEVLGTAYPQGGERQIIYSLTGRKINSSMLPSDKGCLVLNAATCYAIYEAVYRSMPLIHRVLTVTGEGVNEPCNLDVPLGMSFTEVLEAAGGFRDDAVKFISGGPMMGTAMGTLDVPVIKTSNSVVVFTQDDVSAAEQSACIHCGRCAGVCPENLIPQLLAKAVNAEDYERFEELGGRECMECGSCTYVCPAKIPLTQMFKLGKSQARQMRITE